MLLCMPQCECYYIVCTWGYQDRPYPIVYSWSKRSREHGKPFWLSSRNQLSNPTSRAVTIHEGGPYYCKSDAGWFKNFLNYFWTIFTGETRSHWNPTSLPILPVELSQYMHVCFFTENIDQTATELKIEIRDGFLFLDLLLILVHFQAVIRKSSKRRHSNIQQMWGTFIQKSSNITIDMKS